MDFSILPPDPAFDAFFQARLAAIHKHYGSEGFRLLASGQDLCPHCGTRLPDRARQLIRSRPIFCHCDRLLMDARYEHVDVFTTLFTGAKQRLVIARPADATAN